ncbi:DUF3093 family protein [Kutzneria chonburiensis]|uniref:DUF3093 family protein n=1 Tax=Kutzneria chonburiensis TaxID=1483604 RepID=A0ABV6MWJ4_9PSEU|nr:DUF3093 family protein [Kutzneria chonburiensis]
MTTRYAEPGSSFWPVLWAPGFALLGLAVEALSGSVHVLGWLLAAMVLAGVWALWVAARRRLRSVSLTDDVLRLGEEELPVADIAAVEDDEPEVAKVLGGGWTTPKGTGAVPLRLHDGKIVLAWARRPDELRAALRALLAA